MLRDSRPDETVIQAAAGEGSGLVTLNVIPDTGLSTGDRGVAESHAAEGFVPTSTDVPVVSLNALLDNFAGQDLHWLKIDVEGMEESVLRSWGDAFVRPWVVLVEAIDPVAGAPNDRAWRGLIEQRDYHEVFFDGINRFFVANERSDLDAAFAAPAHSLGQFLVPWHHWSAANVVHQFRDEVGKAEQMAQARQDADTANARRAEAVAARDDTARSLAQAIGDRDAISAQLDDLGAERALVSNTIRGLTNQLAARSAEFARLKARQHDLMALSHSLATQLEAANSRVGTLSRRHDAQLLGAFAQMQSLRDEIAALRKAEGIYQDRLQKADEIVALAAPPAAGPVARLQSLASPALRRRQQRLVTAISAWNQYPPMFADAAACLPTSEVNLMDIFAYEHRNPYLRADSLEDLCRFADAAFVRCAYVTILGRQPDPDGERRYTARLRAGASKLAVIADLRLSDEGKRHDPGIAGLDKALRRHRNANRPVVGGIIRLFTGREGNSPVERRLRALTNMFEVEQNRAAARASTANHLQLVLDAKVDKLHKELRAALAGRSASVDQISQAEAAGDTEWEATLNSVLNG